MVLELKYGGIDTMNPEFMLKDLSFYSKLKFYSTLVKWEDEATASGISISIKGFIDGDFFENVAPHFEDVLRNTSSSITLNIEHFHEAQRKSFDELLNRLSRYGDRIYISVNKSLRKTVIIDSSVFNLVLVN